MTVPSSLEYAQPQHLLSVSTAPLVGVLLCLLALWIGATPPLQHSVALEIGSECYTPQAPPQTIHTVSVGSDGAVRWDDQALSSSTVIEARMRALGGRDWYSQAELRIEPNQLADYGAVAAVMASAQRNGVQRVRLVFGGVSLSEPNCGPFHRID